MDVVYYKSYAVIIELFKFKLSQCKIVKYY